MPISKADFLSSSPGNQGNFHEPSDGIVKQSDEKVRRR